MSQTSLVIHGGGLSFAPSHEDREAREAALKEALKEGMAILRQDGHALDAAIKAVMVMEDCPLFNAGKGSVLAADGAIEMDACVMDGQTGRCGGVSAVQTVKNPVQAARAVMDHSPHSLLCAAGAEAFAAAQKLEIVDKSYFFTEERRRSLEKALKRRAFEASESLGTVGAAAYDKNGNLAAATSTGGLTAKMPGRVSDSSIAGAGTWAANNLCALSCTGTGDLFIRQATARDVACLMEYKKRPLKEATAEALARIKAAGGTGGIVALDAGGQVVMDYNTLGMSRGWIRNGEIFVAGF